MLVVVHAEREERIRIISARLATRRSAGLMKKMKNDPDLLEEYDFRVEFAGNTHNVTRKVVTLW